MKPLKGTHLLAGRRANANRRWSQPRSAASVEYDRSRRQSRYASLQTSNKRVLCHGRCQRAGASLPMWRAITLLCWFRKILFKAADGKKTTSILLHGSPIQTRSLPMWASLKKEAKRKARADHVKVVRWELSKKMTAPRAERDERKGLIKVITDKKGAKFLARPSPGQKCGRV